MCKNQSENIVHDKLHVFHTLSARCDLDRGSNIMLLRSVNINLSLIRIWCDTSNITQRQVKNVYMYNYLSGDN